MGDFNRRTFLQGAALAGSSYVVAGAARANPEGDCDREQEACALPAQTTWEPEPAQVPAKQGYVTLPDGARLWYWDTGGKGEPVVLMHASTGSALNWGYQQPVLARAGYRVIAYSARGHYQSDPPSASSPPASQDLHDFLHALNIPRCHLVGTAAGCFTAMDFAVSHQDQLLSLMVGNSFFAITDPDFNNTTGILLPDAFFGAPADFRELGPSYRAANRPGVARWLQLVSQAGAGSQAVANTINWAAVGALRVRALLYTGSADMYLPPAQLRVVASHFRGAQTVVFSEAGHSSYWEQYTQFNRVLLRFLRGGDDHQGHDR